ncbi:MerR family transcriptional regulator [Desulfoplanes formicivorans]|uniref:MerR family transcriptional regulator n=1 Tax=Desulfoplanes formicivorans TaxID=1592317 RepID=A0A194AHA4_9BACT|nr:MerR family transcriptional regulator [Desulfoplanes formicivorans]GAU08595.1 MerR family transcriptional regulator [Desulfoplanes formicivorans]
MSEPLPTTYKIGQAAKAVGVEPHVLRFWETEFPQLVPCRKPSGQRYYTQEHIDLLNRIKKLLYEDKLTIEGARRRLQDHSSLSALLQEIQTELQDLKSLLQEDS